VREFSAEGLDGFTLRLCSDAATWARPEQFELALSFAATLAEDLFRLERLLAVVIDDEAPLVVRRLRDVESFLDRLAVLNPSETPSGRANNASSGRASGARRYLQIEPQGPRGVAAYIDGKIAATA
jgi:hypothetical protein